jgi:hypothetical protein
MATASSGEISSRSYGSSSKPAKNAVSFWAIEARFRWTTLRSPVWPCTTHGNDATIIETSGNGAKSKKLCNQNSFVWTETEAPFSHSRSVMAPPSSTSADEILANVSIAAVSVLLTPSETQLEPAKNRARLMF